MMPSHKGLILLLLCCFLSASAQARLPQSTGGNERFAQVLSNGRVMMQISYNLSRGLEKTGGETDLTFQDGCFLLQAGEFQIYNGKDACWTLNTAVKEAVCDHPLKIDIAASPRQILEILGVNAKGADITTTYSSDGMLRSMTAKLRDGTSIDLKIKNLTATPKAEISDFSFSSSSLDKTWVITDLR